MRGKLLEHGAQLVGADRGGDVAPPQPHVEIGVLAAEELDHRAAADMDAAERPQEQRRADGVEADDDEGAEARFGADMALPERREIVALVGGGERVRALERAPVGSAAAISSNTSTRAMRPATAGSGAAIGIESAQGDDVHGANRGKIVNAGAASQRFINKGLEYSLRIGVRPRNLAGLKKTIIRGGLETLYFSGLYHVMRPLVGGVGVILTLHHVGPPRPTRSSPTGCSRSRPLFFECLLRRLKARAARLISLDEMHASSWSPATSSAASSASPSTTATRIPQALGLSAAQEIRDAVRALHPDQLPGPARRIVVGGARGGDRAEQPHRPGHQRQAAVLRLRDGAGEARALRRGLPLSAQHEDRR